MNKDKRDGKLDNLKGRVKEAAGSITGDKQMQAEGTAERAKGAVQEKVGEGREKVAKAIDDDDDGL